MQKYYIKPETEIIKVLTEAVMIKDSEGEWEGGDANTGQFEEEEISTETKGLWEN